MSSIKRLYEEMLEREDEVVSLLELSKEKRPLLYDMVEKEPKLVNCNKLFKDLTEDEYLKILASFHLSMNHDQ